MWNHRMIRNRGIAFKLSVLILVGTTLILATAFGYMYRFARHTIESNVEQNATNLTLATVNQVEAVLAATEKVPESLAASIEDQTYGTDELLRLLRLTVANNKEIYGATVAFEPYAFEPGAEYFAPYYYKRDGRLEFTWLGGSNYQYFSMDWFKRPKELGHAVWSEPYYDEGGGDTSMTTYSVPFYKMENGEKRFLGVVTADVALDWLHSIVSGIHISDTGYAFLISKQGTVVTHPLNSLVMHQTIFSVADERHDPRLGEIGRDMVRGGTGFVETSCIVRDKPCWLAYAPIPANGWVLGALFPQDELMADVTRLSETVLVLFASGVLLLLLLVVAVARSITRPLTALAAASDAVTRGDLDTALPATRTGDEVGRLTGAFGQMQDHLRRYINELRETTAARERAAAEAIALARECQRAEAQVQEYSRTLEQKVTERTHELTAKNEELEQTLTKLEETQDQLVVQEKLASLGALTAGIAHEIKNPLNFVNNFAQLAGELSDELTAEIAELSTQLPADKQAYVAELLADLKQDVTKINEHGRRADSIVCGMLQHSREQSGVSEPTDLNALLDEYLHHAYHGLRAQDAGFNVRLETDYDPQVGRVALVAQDISRVFLNIINNACYAADAKRQTVGDGFIPTVRVSSRDGGDRVEIRIHDNGTGIPPAARDKIFNPFFTTKPAGKGTGLGLSISFDIVVRQHHGELRVESEEGRFTEFIIVLPKRAAERNDAHVGQDSRRR